MNEEIILLKEELQKRTGIALDTVLGCKRLDAWLKLRGVYISYSTLSRVFGLASLSITPRERTLDELASILGFPNFKGFVSYAKKESQSPIIPFDLQFSFEHAISERKLTKAASIYLQMMEHSPSAKVFAKDLSKALYKDLNESKKALSQLSSSQVGREAFFLTFIDEDDLSGNYRKALNEYFLPNASLSERQFVQLYSLRKDTLRSEQVKIRIVSTLELESYENVHLKSRAHEMNLLKLKGVRIVQHEDVIGQSADKAYQIFCESKNRSEELAVLGRFARGVLYTGGSKYLIEHKNVLTAMQSLLNQPVEDFEFKIPIYALLNQLNKSNELVIPQSSSWPNAYYSSSLFLLNKEQRKLHEMFFKSNLGIHKTFLYADA
ncbi:MAG: hypothetical protein ACOVNZ_04655 [Crocinitomicaceae bacterium]